eukprot:TRINITY_DN13274_c0_g1_i1.p1 TRINITY_DN13274_c0_g1~~TRINITY_DN13274_c0_g1_i1.p1  ORF type:complete len:916 (-),score=231.00 TRINITY_DN13274_c0_g1_i1:159-2906(-)
MALRVNVPRSVVGLFTDRVGAPVVAPRAPLAAAAQALGFASSAELLAAANACWPEWSPRNGSSLSAAELAALVQLLQFKSARCRALARDLVFGGNTRVVSMPSEGLHEEDEEMEEPRVAEVAKTKAKAESSPLKPGQAKRALPADSRLPPWPLSNPEDVGMDKTALDKCRRYLHYRIARKHFAGIVGGVVKDGKLVYFDEAGYADIENKVPMKQDTIVRLFSMTKCIVVVAFLAYAEDPKYGIDLDDPVWKYIPSWKKIKLEPKRGTTKPREMEQETFQEKLPDGKVKKEKGPAGPTLRQLLTHTAGLGYGPTLGDTLPPKNTDHYRIYYDLLERTAKEQITSLEQWVDELAKVPLKARPGSYWEYSFASDVLGRVLEVISGMTLDKVVEEKVCKPLGMVDTGFRVPPEKASRMGAWYEKKNPVDDKGVELEKAPPGATYSLHVIDKPGLESGWSGRNCSNVLSAGGTLEVPLCVKGGMVSTFRDYLRFLMMIRNMGELDGVRILRRETVQTMTCNQIPASTGRRAAWVFDKKGQGFSFIGQIQVQHNEKDTFQEKGELKRGNNTYASLAPGTVSAEYGWGGLGGPAWTIDPRSDLIILSITQTALELDHEENLRFSARRAIHAGIFGYTAGAMKVTDFPPEGHEGLRGGKLWQKGVVTNGLAETELDAFVEAERQAQARGKTLKELAVAKGNEGHEVHDDLEEAPSSKADDDEGGTPASAAGTAPAFSEQGVGARADEANGAGEPLSGRKRPLQRTPSGELTAASPAAASGNGSNAKRRHTAEEGASDDAGAARGGGGVVSAQQPGGVEIPLFARVRLQPDDDQERIQKARVTAVEGDTVEVVTEGSWKAQRLDVGSVALIEESCAPTVLSSSKVSDGPKDFGFMLAGGMGGSGDKNGSGAGNAGATGAGRTSR